MKLENRMLKNRFPGTFDAYSSYLEQQIWLQTKMVFKIDAFKLVCDWMAISRSLSY